MADKSVYIVEEEGGASYIVVSDSASQAKKAMTKELVIRRASAMEVAVAASKGATMIDAETVLAEKEARKAAAGVPVGDVVADEPVDVVLDEPVDESATV